MKYKCVIEKIEMEHSMSNISDKINFKYIWFWKSNFKINNHHLLSHYSRPFLYFNAEPKSFGRKNETVSRSVDGEEVSSSTMMCEACQSLTSCDKIVQCCDGHLNCNTCVEKVVKKVLSHGSEEVSLGWDICVE